MASQKYLQKIKKYFNLNLSFWVLCFLFHIIQWFIIYFCLVIFFQKISNKVNWWFLCYCFVVFYSG